MEEETAEAALEARDGGDAEFQAAGEVGGFGDAIAEEIKEEAKAMTATLAGLQAGLEPRR